MKREAKMILLFGDNSGVYVPQRFAQEIARTSTTGVSEGDYAALEAGPDHEGYWDTWTHVLDHAKLTDADGTQYFLLQDGDCWAIEAGALFCGEGGEPRPDNVGTDWYMDDGEEDA